MECKAGYEVWNAKLDMRYGMQGWMRQMLDEVWNARLDEVWNADAG